MGRNIQAVPIRTSYQKRLEKFTSSLGNAVSKGETISLADKKSKLLFGPFAGAAYGFLLFLFMHLLFKIARAIVDLKRMGTIEAGRRFENRMKKISPDFSHEPGCGNEYELISDDWVLAELKQSK